MKCAWRVRRNGQLSRLSPDMDMDRPIRNAGRGRTQDSLGPRRERDEHDFSRREYRRERDTSTDPIPWASESQGSRWPSHLTSCCRDPTLCIYYRYSEDNHAFSTLSIFFAHTSYF